MSPLDQDGNLYTGHRIEIPVVPADASLPRIDDAQDIKDAWADNRDEQIKALTETVALQKRIIELLDEKVYNLTNGLR